MVRWSACRPRPTMCYAPLRDHFFEVGIAEAVAQVPADAQEDDLGRVVSPLEGIILRQSRRLHARCSCCSHTVADAAISCNRTTSCAQISNPILGPLAHAWYACHL